MKKTIVIMIFLFLTGIASHAKAEEGAKTSAPQIITDEDKEIAELLEMLELKEILEEMELIKEYHLFAEEETNEKD